MFQYFEHFLDMNVQFGQTNLNKPSEVLIWSRFLHFITLKIDLYLIIAFSLIYIQSKVFWNSKKDQLNGVVDMIIFKRTLLTEILIGSLKIIVFKFHVEFSSPRLPNQHKMPIIQ